MNPDVERIAAERLRRAEAEHAEARRPRVTLGTAFRAFWRYPSPWMISTTLVAAIGLRIGAGGWRWTEALAPVALVVAFPFIEWLVHVCILHWRPRRVAGREIDSLLARKHRAHHADPRDLPLVFIPWQSLVAVLMALVLVALLAFPRAGMGLTFLVSVATLGLVYEWTHYLIHGVYQPRSRVYKSVWRSHRLHHYKNEHYWFTVTTTATADRVFGTYPDPATVEKSATAKNLHGTW
jgi:sterol desaturase/sphingolipid hydroxylase (fatty acid hydroxylase superfamily)